MSNLVKYIGISIRSLRKQRGYTQEYLAEKANIHYSYIGGIERGERNISLGTLEKIITALEAEPVEIFENPIPYKVNDDEPIHSEALCQINQLLAPLTEDQLKKIHQILKIIVSDFSNKDDKPNTSNTENTKNT